MVKTTYALTLFAAVSLAAPVAQLNGRAEKENSVEHKNLIEDIPILGKMLAGKQDAKRDEGQHHGLVDDVTDLGGLLGRRRDAGSDGISGLPIIGRLFGTHAHSGGENGMNKRRSFGQNQDQNAGQNEGQNYGQNAGQNEGQNAGQNAGQNHGQNHGQNNGQNAGQNGGKNWQRDLESSLSGIPLVGNLFQKSKDTPSHQQTETPAKHLDNRQAGHSKGVFGILQSLTSGGPISKSHKRDESAAPKANEGQQGNQKGADSPTDLLGELMGEDGLGSLKGNSEHGFGLIPMRRDAKELEARQAPIQGSTLTGVLFEGGALGKVSNFLSGGAKPNPGASSPTDMGDGSTSGPPDPASGAGPHSGPGLAAQQQQQQGSGAASE
ncbi:hypothetical protein N7527_012043 [Penicillium freii]|uniref:Uncharacterized protein n=1 Tax=Penicillium freii TaxID=48697 RepID=A0A101MDS1_PENFR|nr:hypothetical protein N7527_012043 [Penicillium freii]KUM58726.1 hypothetical protein ACN42_g8414 [Penicillium freii]